MDPERIRLEEQRRGDRRWDLFGPYLSERAWATVSALMFSSAMFAHLVAEARRGPCMST